MCCQTWAAGVRGHVLASRALPGPPPTLRSPRSTLCASSAVSPAGLGRPRPSTGPPARALGPLQCPPAHSCPRCGGRLPALRRSGRSGVQNVSAGPRRCWGLCPDRERPCRPRTDPPSAGPAGRLSERQEGAWGGASAEEEGPRRRVLPPACAPGCWAPSSSPSPLDSVWEGPGGRPGQACREGGSGPACLELGHSWALLSVKRFLSTWRYYHLNRTLSATVMVWAQASHPCGEVVQLWDANLRQMATLKSTSYEEFVWREALFFVPSLFPPLAFGIAERGGGSP